MRIIPKHPPEQSCGLRPGTRVRVVKSFEVFGQTFNVGEDLIYLREMFDLNIGCDVWIFGSDESVRSEITLTDEAYLAGGHKLVRHKNLHGLDAFEKPSVWLPNFKVLEVGAVSLPFYPADVERWISEKFKDPTRALDALVPVSGFPDLLRDRVIRCILVLSNSDYDSVAAWSKRASEDHEYVIWLAETNTRNDRRNNFENSLYAQELATPAPQKKQWWRILILLYLLWVLWKVGKEIITDWKGL